MKNDPDNTKALFRRAQAYINEGNTTRAREDLEKLSAKNPEGKRYESIYFIITLPFK